MDYSKGKIYQLKCLTTGLIYVGSTTKQYLSQRLVAHKSDFWNWKNGKKGYVTSFQILEGDNYEITLLESFPCKTNDELRAREKHWIQSLDCVNKVIPCRTRAEYKEDNREAILAYAREYSATHYSKSTSSPEQWDKYLASRRRMVVCSECGAEISRGSLHLHRKSKKHLEALEAIRQPRTRTVATQTDDLPSVVSVTVMGCPCPAVGVPEGCGTL